MANRTLTSSSLSRSTPVILTVTGLVAAFGCYAIYKSYHSTPPPSLHRSNAVYRRRRSPRAEQAEQADAQPVEEPETQPSGGNEDAQTVAGTELTDIPGHGTSREGQNLKQMLYYIAEHQSREEGYIHRGVKCNQCDVKPIRGIRWRCANCADYDLCSDCEAQSMHYKTHLFYKVKIPAPFLGNPRQSQPVIYPGKPQIMRRNLRHDFRQRMVKDTEFELHEVDALYEQFSCLADEQWDADPNSLGAAINRRTFDKTFTPLSSVTPPKPNLIYDRMFAFYDTNRDGLIGFEEFLRGLATLYGKLKGADKLRRVFDGYDIDEDGYVSRKDFLRMFRAFYAIQKEITRDLLAVQQEDENLTVDAQFPLIDSSQPLSAAFGFSNMPGDRNTPQNKPVNEFGDRRAGQSPTQESRKDQVDRFDVVGNAWELSAGFPLYRSTGDPISLSGMAISVQDDEGNPVTSDVEFTYDGKPVSEARLNAINERWRRKQFYTDEEEGVEVPEGFEGEVPGGSKHTAQTDESAEARQRDSGISDYRPSEDDRSTSLNTTSGANAQSRRSIELETSINDSALLNSIRQPLRQYKIPQAEKDLGKDILYQVTQQGLNELLDPLFKQKEDLAMATYVTKIERRKWRKEINDFLEQREQERRRAALEAQDPLMATAAAAEGTEKLKHEPSKDADEAVSDIEKKVQEQSLDELLQESSYTLLDDAELQDRLQRSLSPSPEPEETVPLANGYARDSAEHHQSDQNSPEEPADKDHTFQRQDRLGLGDDERGGIDSTLPHMRPDTPPELDRPSPHPSRRRTDRLSAQEQQNVNAAIENEYRERFVTMVLGRAPLLDLENSSLSAPDRKVRMEVSALEPDEPSASDGPPTGERLEYLAKLTEVEREIGARGGPGRLSYEEFASFMRSDDGRRMSYVEGWLELGSF